MCACCAANWATLDMSRRPARMNNKQSFVTFVIVIDNNIVIVINVILAVPSTEAIVPYSYYYSLWCY